MGGRVSSYAYGVWCHSSYDEPLLVRGGSCDFLLFLFLFGTSLMTFRVRWNNEPELQIANDFSNVSLRAHSFIGLLEIVREPTAYRGRGVNGGGSSNPPPGVPAETAPRKRRNAK